MTPFTGISRAMRRFAVGGLAAGFGMGTMMAANAATPSGDPTSRPASTAACDDGGWLGPAGSNVNGRPDGFDAGNAGAAYVWHDNDGWHLRTTDVTSQAHRYSGTIALSAGARVTSLAPYRNEHGDRVWVTGDNVIHYSVVTHRGLDGLDFRISACAGDRQHETLRFSMDFNGHEDDSARIKLGDSKQSPPSATFTVRRSI